MSKCNSCKKEDTAPLTYWQRFRKWVFSFFVEDTLDLRDDYYTQGFGKGYQEGFKVARERSDENMKLLFQGHECPKPCTVDVLVNPYYVLDVHKTGVLLVNGQRVSQEETKQLREEARYLKATRLYEIFQNTLKQKAIDMGLKEASNWDVTLAAKMMLHSLGIMKSMTDTCEKVQVDPKSMV